MAKNYNAKMSKGKGRFSNNKRTSNGVNSNKSDNCSKFGHDDDTKSKFNANKSTSFNDPAWYGMDQALLRDSASVPFVFPMGAPVSTGLKDLPKTTIPGICAMELCPTFGYSNEPRSAINVASKSLYTFVRHANSGSRTYDAPDLMMYILAAADVFSYINFLQRVYGVAMLYNQMNRYIPEALLRAMHVDPNSIRNNLANFRYGINVLINKAASLAVPANITLFRRKAFIYSNIYKEGMSIKDQLYMFVPAGFYQYSDPGNLLFRPFVPGTLTVPTSPSARSNSFKTDDHTEMTYEDLISYGYSLLDTLFGSEDMGLMNGDILKAYGTEGILKLQELPENYAIDFVFDIAVLEQMKNAYVTPVTFANGTDDTPAFRRDTWSTPNSTTTYPVPIWIKNNDVIHGPYMITEPMAHTSDLDLCNKWITTQSEVVTPELVMENSRLVPGFDPFPAPDEAWNRIRCMTEVLAQVHYYQFNADGVTLESTNQNSVDYTIDISKKKAVEDIARMGAFRFRPFSFISANYGTSNAPDRHIALFTNIDNYTVCDNQTVSRLNDTALMSLLNVPSVAKAY